MGLVKRALSVAAVAAVAVLIAVCGVEGGASGEDAPSGLPATTFPQVNPTAPPRPAEALTPTPYGRREVNPETISSGLREAKGVVDPTNLGWPREIETEQGRATIKAAPQRVHTLSLGHDEIIVALIGAKRVAGIGSFTADPIYSNIAAEVKDLPKVRRDAEAVLALNPDLVIASKFTNQALIDRIRGAGVTVIRTDLEDSAAGNIPNILLLGYMLGAEKRALELASEIRSRIEAVDLVVRGIPPGQRVRALSIAKFAESIDAAGANTTEGGIVLAAGAVNAAAEADIDGHKAVSIESIAAMKPDYIILTQPVDSGTKFRDELMAAAALAEVPAVKNNRIVLGDPRYYTTLSHWNVRGIEEAAKLFYADKFAGVSFRDFEPFKE